jgi:preprotein translocase subunit SecA
MVNAIREETVRRVFLARIKKEESVKREAVARVTGESGAGDGSIKQQPVRRGEKVGRNDPCPCGSGKKYKKCCGANE